MELIHSGAAQLHICAQPHSGTAHLHSPIPELHNTNRAWSRTGKSTVGGKVQLAICSLKLAYSCNTQLHTCSYLLPANPLPQYTYPPPWEFTEMNKLNK